MTSRHLSEEEILNFLFVMKVTMIMAYPVTMMMSETQQFTSVIMNPMTRLLQVRLESLFRECVCLRETLLMRILSSFLLFSVFDFLHKKGKISSLNLYIYDKNISGVIFSYSDSCLNTCFSCFFFR